MTEPDYAPLIEFMQRRAPWFTVAVVPALNGRGGCKDVVLRIDGTYTDDKLCREMLGPVTPDLLAHWLGEALVAAQITNLEDWQNDVKVRTS
jgi:hypothetical protein